MDQVQNTEAGLPHEEELELIDLRDEERKKLIDITRRMKKSADPLISSHSEDIAESSYEFERLKRAEISCCLLALLGFGCGAIASDLEYVQSIYEQKKTEAAIVTIAGTVSTCLLLLAIWWRTKQELRWTQAKGYYSYQDDLTTTQKYRWLLVEFALNLPHPIHWLYRAEFAYYNSVKDATIHYTYNSWLAVWQLVRIYHVIRLISILSFYRSGRAQRVCQMNGTYPGSWFAVRCLMKEIPYLALGAILVVGMLMGAFMLRIFERPMRPYTNIDYSEYGNAMWNVLITMTTVGYGDYYPVTLLGRISGILVCFLGVFVVSMMVVTVTSVLNLDSSEEKALMILNRLSFKGNLTVVAANLLTSALHYRFLRKHNARPLKLELQLGKLRKNLNAFQMARNRQRAIYGEDSHEDRVEGAIGDIEDSLSELKEGMSRVEEILIRALSGKSKTPATQAAMALTLE